MTSKRNPGRKPLSESETAELEAQRNTLAALPRTPRAEVSKVLFELDVHFRLVWRGQAREEPGASGYYFDSMRQLMEDFGIPLEIVVEQTIATIDTLHPPGVATYLRYVASACAHCVHALRLEDQGAPPDVVWPVIVDAWRENGSAAAITAIALEKRHPQDVRRANSIAAKQAKADEKKQTIKAAALQLTNKRLSRGAVAARIASEVGRKAGTVGKQLTELWPGKRWGARFDGR